MKLAIGAGECDEDALPARMRVEVARISGRDATGVKFISGKTHLAGHLDVTAEGDCGDLVLSVAAAKTEEALTKADGEDFDADTAELGDGEVAELVDQNHDAEDDEKLDDCCHEVRKDLVTWLAADYRWAPLSWRAITSRAEARAARSASSTSRIDAGD